jgi:hypothetical protein
MTPPAIILFVLVLLAALADLYTTKRAVIDNPTRFHEANRLMAILLLRLGPVGLVLSKLAVVAGIGWALHAYPGIPFYAAAGFAALVWGWAAWHNKRLLTSRR